ncbi:invasion protein CiaB, partial [Patescibacteria group bacterium]|nr:invasion protein CiaB [Patescibacteria group bacterium]
MNKREFKENLKEIYNISDRYDKETSSYFSAVNKKCEEKDFIDLFLTSKNIPITKESRFAIISKLVFLKNNPIIQHLKKENFSEEKIEQIKRNIYLWVKEFYEKKFEKFIKEIEKKNLLPKFYLEIFKGVHKVGLEMNNLEVAWKNHTLIINKELENKFKNKQKIMEYLRENNLLDLGHHNIEADRCYSALIKTKKGYEKKSYFEAFQETKKVIRELENFKNNLEKLDDEIYNQKQEYLDYLKVLIIAFSETNTDNLVFKWADADKAWMKITTPIQISHPFEDYDDAYRKSVSIEWDLRLENFLLEKSRQKEKSKKMYEKLFKEVGKENHKEIYEKSKEHIEKVQLYLSKPILFYGSNLNGLASAQVIPNDLEISKIFGKKIFGFSDMILKQGREKPFTKLSKE